MRHRIALAALALAPLAVGAQLGRFGGRGSAGGAPLAEPGVY